MAFMLGSLQRATYVPNLKHLSWFRPWLQKWIWPICSCQVGRNDPIVMKLICDMSCHLLNVYTNIQIDICKHVDKSPENTGGRKDGRTKSTTQNRQIEPTVEQITHF